MFNRDRSEVALIKKNRPEWQKGFLNAIGGKIEEGEHEINAMCREFEEETGLKTYYYDWKYLIKLINKNPDWEVQFFKGNVEDFSQIKSITDEEVVIINVSNLENEKVIPNLHWLIKMCLDDEVVGGNITNKSKIK
jgi:8-oxo-dGTP diphosphatase